MSYVKINNSEDRLALARDYDATLKRLQKRNFEKRVGDSTYQQALYKQYEPIIKSNQKTTDEICDNLKPIKKEMHDLNNHVKKEEEEAEENNGDLVESFKRKLMANDPDLDLSYGIRFNEDHMPMMGDKHVRFIGNDIVIDGQRFNGTPGVWRLITGNTEDQIGIIGEDYSEDDLLTYVRLIHVTHVLYRDFDPTETYPRSSSGYKWKKLLKTIWKQKKRNANNEVEEERGSGLQDPIRGSKLYMQKHGKCYRIQTNGDEQLYLEPAKKLQKGGSGMFLRCGNNIYKSLVSHTDFKNNPAMKWICNAV